MAINWVEGDAPVKDFVRALATALTSAASDAWTLTEPTDINSVADKAVISTVTNGQTFYVEIERPSGIINYVNFRISKSADFSGDSSEIVRCAWYMNNPKLYLQDWLPVKFWISFNADYINCVVQGDDAVDIPPKYNNFLTSFFLLGSCEGYENAVLDETGNFLLTAGADIRPMPKTTFGLYTGNGISDIIMAGTRTGVPYQRHDSKYDAINQFIRNHRVRESLWTQKYHASQVTLHHHTDGERGKIRNLLVGSKGGLNHANELILDKGLPTEETYKFFDINAPYKFLNNGPNALYGLYLRKA